MWAGSWFQACGAATEKALEPKPVRDRGASKRLTLHTGKLKSMRDKNETRPNIKNMTAGNLDIVSWFENQ